MKWDKEGKKSSKLCVRGRTRWRTQAAVQSTSPHYPTGRVRDWAIYLLNPISHSLRAALGVSNFLTFLASSTWAVPLWQPEEVLTQSRRCWPSKSPTRMKWLNPLGGSHGVPTEREKGVTVQGSSTQLLIQLEFFLPVCKLHSTGAE